jgi:nucleotide-binding universal stress UspA family protein
MPTVLVPLDEPPFAHSIFPDAWQLAGPSGRIVLAYVLSSHYRAPERSAHVDTVQRYLSEEAHRLQAQHLRVETRVFIGGDVPRALDEGVSDVGADFVAVATHGTGHGGRLARSSIAWKTLAHSPVPILFRHTQDGRVRDLDEAPAQPVTIMVPLDGSGRAEQAVPVATALAKQWQGSLFLAQIGADATGGQAYLGRVARGLAVSVTMVLEQGTMSGEVLARLARDHEITHVVMTSHGRTGLSRVIAGDVAADLIDRLSLPIIVVPALAALANQLEPRTPQEWAPVPARLPAVG